MARRNVEITIEEERAKQAQDASKRATEKNAARRVIAEGKARLAADDADIGGGSCGGGSAAVGDDDEIEETTPTTTTTTCASRARRGRVCAVWRVALHGQVRCLAGTSF